MVWVDLVRLLCHSDFVPSAWYSLRISSFTKLTQFSCTGEIEMGDYRWLVVTSNQLCIDKNRDWSDLWPYGLREGVWNQEQIRLIITGVLSLFRMLEGEESTHVSTHARHSASWLGTPWYTLVVGRAHLKHLIVYSTLNTLAILSL